MSTRMRAKFKVSSVQKSESGESESVQFSAVCADGYGPNGENEDNDFARYTPFGELSMTITNPSLIGKLQVDEKYYLDFTPVQETVEA